MSYPALPTLGLIAAILVLIPLPRQLQARYIPTIALTWWLFGTCVFESVNAIVWAGNVKNSLPVWCDISSRFILAANVGLPAATFCICKHLERASSGRPVAPHTDRFSGMIFESALCFLLPCFFLFVVYCFQTSRFAIYENLGCVIPWLDSNVAVVVCYLLPLLLSVATLILGCIAFYRLKRHHRANTSVLDSHLQSRNSSLSSVQYYRLIAVSMILGIWGVGWIIGDFSLNIMYASGPTPSWKTIHSTESTVVEVPANLYPPETVAFWWAAPGAAYLYFILFGTSREVLSDYQKFWVWFRTRVLGQTVLVESMSAAESTSHNVSTYLKTVTLNQGQEVKPPRAGLSSV